jgi:hypothetical protein
MHEVKSEEKGQKTATTYIYNRKACGEICRYGNRGNEGDMGGAGNFFGRIREEFLLPRQPIEEREGCYDEAISNTELKGEFIMIPRDRKSISPRGKNELEDRGEVLGKTVIGRGKQFTADK